MISAHWANKNDRIKKADEPVRNNKKVEGKTRLSSNNAVEVFSVVQA
jgi:hypothetical protein